MSVEQLNSFRESLCHEEIDMLPRIYFGFDRLGIDPTKFDPVVFSWNGGASFLFSHVNGFMGAKTQIDGVIGAIAYHIKFQSNIPHNKFHNQFKYGRNVKRHIIDESWDPKLIDTIHNLLQKGK